jgi:hypothetical protein
VNRVIGCGVCCVEPQTQTKLLQQINYTKKLTYQAQVGYAVPESSGVVELKVLNFALIFKNRLIKKIFPL